MIVDPDKLSQGFYMLLLILINKKIITLEDIKAIDAAAECPQGVFGLQASKCI